jgi:hypothetical protein
VIATLEKAKRVITRAVSPGVSEQQVESARVAVRVLEEKRLVLRQKFSVALSALAAIAQEQLDALHELISSPGAESAEQYVRAKARSDAARHGQAMLSQVFQSGESDQRWRKQHPGFRDALARLAELRSRFAQQQLDEITARETKRLSGKDFSAEQIADSLEVRRARSTVESSARVLKAIETDDDQTVWRWASQLVED